MLRNLSFNFPKTACHPNIRFGAAEAMAVERLHTGFEVQKSIIQDTVRKLIEFGQLQPGRNMLAAAYGAAQSSPSMCILGIAADLDISNEQVFQVINAALYANSASPDSHIEIHDPINNQILVESRFNRPWNVYPTASAYLKQQ
jgi:hypothetical protein